MDNDNFINEIISSTNGMTKVVPKDSLLLNIQNKINRDNYISSTTLWKVAASIFILISLNFISLDANRTLFTKNNSSFENNLNKSNQLY